MLGDSEGEEARASKMPEVHMSFLWAKMERLKRVATILSYTMDEWWWLMRRVTKRGTVPTRVMHISESCFDKQWISVMILTTDFDFTMMKH